MRRFLFLFISMVVTSYCFATDATDSTTIEFNQTVSDFITTYEADGSIPIDFTFTNSGQQPLKINRIIGTSSKNVSFPHQEFAPGEKGVIQFNMDPFGNPGIYEKTIIVFSNAKNSPTLLTIKGKIISGTKNSSFTSKVGPLAFKQLQFNFGYIFNGDVNIRYVPVKNTSNTAAQIVFTDLPEHLKINNKFESIPAGKTGLLEIIYNTNLIDDWDFVIDKIGITSIASDTAHNSLMISANIRENFTLLSPEATINKPKTHIPIKVFNYDTIPPSEIVSYDFPIYNKGERDLIIRSVKPTCGCTAAMPIKNTIAPGDSSSISVQFNPHGYSGQDKKGVTVITNDPDNYKHFLWVSGYIE